MKRDMDRVREVLLMIEEAPVGAPLDFTHTRGNAEHAELDAYLTLLKEAGLIRAEHRWSTVRSHWREVDLTWAGHDFLNTIRDDSVWAKTKQQLAKVGGSASIEVVSQVATGFVKGILNLP